jgi:hypothetical protein
LQVESLRAEAMARHAANLTSPGAVPVRVLSWEAPQGGVVPEVAVASGPIDAVDVAVESASLRAGVPILKKALQIQAELVGLLLDLKA